MSNVINDEPVFTVPLASTQDALAARRVVWQLAHQLQLDVLESSRLSAAVFLLAQRVVRQQQQGELRLSGSPLQQLILEVTEQSSALAADPMPIVPNERLLENTLLAILDGLQQVTCRSDGGSWSVRITKALPRRLAGRADREQLQAAARKPPDTLEDLQEANQAILWLLGEILRLDQEVQRRQQRCEQLQLELQETNHGVLALYAELEETVAQLRDLNETLEDRVAQRTAEAQRRADQLRLLALELSQTEQRERRRLAQVLHDHLQQLLVAARMSVDELRRNEPAVLADKSQSILQRIDDLLGESIDASRSLTVELSPPVLHDAGLIPALNWLRRQQQEKHGLKVIVQADSQAEPSSEQMRVLLFQAVRELLFNTVKHAQVDEAVVHVHCDDEQQLVIQVRDEGVGFEPDASQPSVEGGFGLFSVRERLQLLGASFEIQSAHQKGTCVTIVAPLHLDQQPRTHRQDPPEACSSTRQHAPAERPARIRVLVADDHRGLRASFARLLRGEPDMELVGEAADGRATVEMADQLRPQVVLMDVSMPHLDGIEATRRICQRLPRTRVIGLSMYQDKEMETAMYEAGAAAYLLKDTAADNLLAAVRGAVSTQAAVEP